MDQALRLHLNRLMPCPSRSSHEQPAGVHVVCRLGVEAVGQRLPMLVLCQLWLAGCHIKPVITKLDCSMALSAMAG